MVSAALRAIAIRGERAGVWATAEQGVLDLERMIVEQHPLGMYCGRVGIPGGEVRLHLWCGGSMSFRDELPVVHDHIWHLESHVLVGALRQRTYEVAGSGSSSVWIHDYNQQSISLLHEGVGLSISTSDEVRAGSSYTLGHGILHSTAPDFSGTLTLVVARTGPGHAARIVGEGLPGRSTRQTVPLSAMERELESII